MGDTTEGGTEWELKEAENAIVAAGTDLTALALAMRRHTEAQRNMMQSVLVPSFEHAVDAITEKHTIRILKEVGISLDMILESSKAGVTIAREALAVSRAGAEELVKLKKAVVVLKKGQTVSDKRLDDMMERLKQLATVVETTNQLADKTNQLAEEHNRLMADQAVLAQDVADLMAWRASLGG